MLHTILPRGLIVIKELGAGGNGKVYLTQHHISLNKYVVKVFRDRPNVMKVMEGGREMPLEIATLRKLHHPNIVKYKTHFLHDGAWHLLMDYEPGFHDLHTVIQRAGGLQDGAVQDLAHQLHSALNYCLQHNIDHGDIKEENILYNPKTNRIKLIDFGTALPLSKSLNYLRGTTVCLPPEAFLKPRYFPLQATVWAVGCVLYGCMTGRPAFLSPTDILNKRLRVPETSRGKFSKKLVNLVERCLEPNQVMRIMWTELGRNL